MTLAVLMGSALSLPPQITYTIAKTYQPLKPGSVLSFQNAALGSVGEHATHAEAPFFEYFY